MRGGPPLRGERRDPTYIYPVPRKNGGVKEDGERRNFELTSRDPFFFLPRMSRWHKGEAAPRTLTQRCRRSERRGANVRPRLVPSTAAAVVRRWHPKQALKRQAAVALRAPSSLCHGPDEAIAATWRSGVYRQPLGLPISLLAGDGRRTPPLWRPPRNDPAKRRVSPKQFVGVGASAAASRVRGQGLASPGGRIARSPDLSRARSI